MSAPRRYPHRESVETIRTLVGGLEPCKVLLKTLVADTEADIRAALARGVTYTEMAEALTAKGFPVKPSTLKAMLVDLSKGTRSAPAAAARKITVRPAAET